MIKIEFSDGPGSRLRRLTSNGVHSINAAALLIGAAGLLSRLMGVLRDRLLAGHFGASRELDIYYAAFQIPDFVFMLFLLGAASAAIIPVFIEIKERFPEEAKIFIGELLGVFFVISLIIGGGAAFFAPKIMYFIAPGFGVSERASAVFLTRIMMISPILLGLSSIVSAVIQCNRRFFAFAVAPIFYNLGIITGIVFFLPWFGVAGLGVGVVLGAALHLVVQIPSFYGIGNLTSFAPILARYRSLCKTFLGIPIPYRISDPIARVLQLSFPRVIASSLNQITFLVLVAISSTLASGSISVLQFAYNLHFLPIGIFGVSFAVAAFPSMNEYYIRRDSTSFLATYYGTIRTICFWVLPLSVLFYVLRAQIVRVALGAGKFDWEDTMLTAALLGVMTVSIVAESIIPLFLRVYYALGNTVKPLFINAAVSLATILGAVWFINVFQGMSGAVPRSIASILRIGSLENIAILGIGLAISLGAVLNLVMLSTGIKKELSRHFGGSEDHKIPGYLWGDVGLMGSVALISGGISFWVLRAVNFFVALETFWGVFLQGVVSFSAGLLFYGAVLYVSGNREARQLVETIRKHFAWDEVLPEQLEV